MPQGTAKITRTCSLPLWSTERRDAYWDKYYRYHWNGCEYNTFSFYLHLHRAHSHHQALSGICNSMTLGHTEAIVPAAQMLRPLPQYEQTAISNHQNPLRILVHICITIIINNSSNCPRISVTKKTALLLPCNWTVVLMNSTAGNINTLMKHIYLTYRMRLIVETQK